jgi:predicted ATP-grasp superfamily ATP-dependent carboligase
MRIFVHEFVTGGGFAGKPLPAGLLRQADMMVRCLLQDLEEIPGIDLLVSRDERLPELPGYPVLLPVRGEDAGSHFDRGVQAADAVWTIAPETGAVLEGLARRVLEAGKVLLGSPPEAIAVAASKSATYAALRVSGIPAPPTFGHPGSIPPLAGPWVVKPDDGVGSEGVLRVPDFQAARQHLEAESGLIAQPWLVGDPQSLSVICAGGQARLLSCNRQRIRIEDRRVSLTGVEVNAFPDHSGRLARLARHVAGAIPSLWGYVGVDLVHTDEGPIVVDINPRLTTSYCGLRRALGLNVARIVLGLLQPEPWSHWHHPEPGLNVNLALAGDHDL